MRSALTCHFLGQRVTVHFIYITRNEINMAIFKYLNDAIVNLAAGLHVVNLAIEAHFEFMIFAIILDQSVSIVQDEELRESASVSHSEDTPL